MPIAELRGRLEPLGRVDLVGASFSVLKLTAGGETVDVALPRRERSLGAGHRDFEVRSGPEITLEEDLGRRDFRMNMLARAIPSGQIVDPYGGEADLRARRIDILTPETFAEDPLRMLRGAQFAARFEYATTPQLRAAMTAAAPLVRTVSAERINEELGKLLTKANKPSLGLELLRETGLLEHLWPELLEGVGVEQNEWHAYDVWHHAMATVDAAPPGEVSVRLAALLHDVGKPRTKDGPHFYRHEIVGAELTRSMLERFKFSNEAIRSGRALGSSAHVRSRSGADRRRNSPLYPTNSTRKPRTLVRYSSGRHRRQRPAQARWEQRGVRSARLAGTGAQAGVFDARTRSQRRRRRRRPDAPR